MNSAKRTVTAAAKTLTPLQVLTTAHQNAQVLAEELEIGVCVKSETDVWWQCLGSSTACIVQLDGKMLVE